MKNTQNALKVVQKNVFIQQYQRRLRTLTFNDLLLFKTIVSKINAKDTLFRESYTITYSELDKAGFCTKDRYRTLNQCLDNLSSVVLEVQNTKKQIVRCGVIKNHYTFLKRSQEIKIGIYPEMADFLLNIKQKFTMYPLQILASLNNKYEILLYEYFKSISSMRHQKLSIETLREILHLNEEYKQIVHLKKLLHRTISKINEVTDISVQYKDIKSKRSITGFAFVVMPRDTFNPKDYINKKYLLNNTVIEIVDIVYKDDGYKIKVQNGAMVGHIQNQSQDRDTFSKDELRDFLQNLMIP